MCTDYFVFFFITLFRISEIEKPVIELFDGMVINNKLGLSITLEKLNIEYPKLAGEVLSLYSKLSASSKRRVNNFWTTIGDKSQTSFFKITNGLVGMKLDGKVKNNRIFILKKIK